MIDFVSILHVIFALLLITFVLLQDSKGGGTLFGGETSQTIFGATGATSFLVKATRTVAIMFAVTCVTLTIATARKSKSILDRYVPGKQPSATAPKGAAQPPSTTNAVAPTATTPTNGVAAPQPPKQTQPANGLNAPATPVTTPAK